jgi:hypothetical protein
MEDSIVSVGFSTVIEEESNHEIGFSSVIEGEKLVRHIGQQDFLP